MKKIKYSFLIISLVCTGFLSSCNFGEDDPKPKNVNSNYQVLLDRFDDMVIGEEMNWNFVSLDVDYLPESTNADASNVTNPCASSTGSSLGDGAVLSLSFAFVKNANGFMITKRVKAGTCTDPVRYIFQSYNNYTLKKETNKIIFELKNDNGPVEFKYELVYDKESPDEIHMKLLDGSIGDSQLEGGLIKAISYDLEIIDHVGEQ